MPTGLRKDPRGHALSLNSSVARFRFEECVDLNSKMSRINVLARNVNYSIIQNILELKIVDLHAISCKYTPLSSEKREQKYFKIKATNLQCSIFLNINLKICHIWVGEGCHVPS
jgi:hypothetical protein